ncbi:MAG: hypothetical protein SFW67_12065 [Myxococcaceae bacterium]|nr:hypothetical protein [Myxococcaceae bacterium]
MARFVVASAVVVFVFGSACGGAMGRPDGGSVSLVGGGTSGVGGSGGSGGGSSGGGTGGGSGGGMSTGGGSSGACVQLAQIPNQAFFGGAFGPGNPDGGNGFEFIFSVAALDIDRDAGLGVFAFNELYWDFPGPQPTFPRSFTLAQSTYQQCYDCFVIRTCQLDDLDRCSPRGFMAQAGSGTYQSATLNRMTGGFAGSATNLRYVAWDFAMGADRAVPDAGCIDVASMSWSVTWPRASTDGGAPDGGP